jgi:hypothetical protein
MFIKFIWLAIAALLSNMSFAQQADPIQCPKRITVAQQIEQDLDTGWEPINRKDSHPLVSVSLFEGHPKEMAELVPIESKSKKRGLQAKWNIGAQGNIWLACNYANSNAAVAIRLSSDIVSCTAKYDPAFSSPVIKSLICHRKS